MQKSHLINSQKISNIPGRDASAKILDKRELEPGLEVNDRLMSEMRRRLILMRVSSPYMKLSQNTLNPF